MKYEEAANKAIAAFKEHTNLVFCHFFTIMICMKALSTKMGVKHDFDVQIIEKKDLFNTVAKG